jgi:hypothetical protein
MCDVEGCKYPKEECRFVLHVTTSDPDTETTLFLKGKPIPLKTHSLTEPYKACEMFSPESTEKKLNEGKS